MPVLRPSSTPSTLARDPFARPLGGRIGPATMEVGAVLDSESAEEGNRTLTPLRAQRPERCVSTSSTTSARCPQMVSAAERPAHRIRAYGGCHAATSSYRADSGPTDGIGATGAGALKTTDTRGVYRNTAGASSATSAATWAAAPIRVARAGDSASMSSAASRNGSGTPPVML